MEPTPNSPTEPAADNSLFGRLCRTIDDLADAAVKLRDALVHRRADEIWRLLAVKQQRAGELEQYLGLWQELHATPPAAAAGDTELSARRERIRESLTTLRGLEQRNATLCRSFLAAIDRALTPDGRDQGSGAGNVYTQSGRHAQRNRSLLVRQYG